MGAKVPSEIRVCVMRVICVYVLTHLHTCHTYVCTYARKYVGMCVRFHARARVMPRSGCADLVGRVSCGVFTCWWNEVGTFAGSRRLPEAGTERRCGIDSTRLYTCGYRGARLRFLE